MSKAKFWGFDKYVGFLRIICPFHECIASGRYIGYAAWHVTFDSYPFGVGFAPFIDSYTMFITTRVCWLDRSSSLWLLQFPFLLQSLFVLPSDLVIPQVLFHFGIY